MRFFNELLRLATAAVIVAALSACSPASTKGGDTPTPATTTEVVISNYTFAPKTLTIPVGTTVTWVNHDMARHTVTHDSFDGDAFNSGLLSNQAVFTHTFETAGTYGYVCQPHAGMQGTIVVK